MIHRNLFATVAWTPLASSLCAALAGPTGSGMFTVPMGTVDAEGETTHTHNLSTGPISDQFAALMPCYLSATGETYPGDLVTLAALAAEAGIETAETELTQLFNECYVSDHEYWQDAAAVLGVVKV